MEGFYSIIFNIRYFQYGGDWDTASFYYHAERHQKLLCPLASHPNDSRDNPLAQREHKTRQQKYFYGASQMGCRAALCQRHPSGGHSTM